MREISKTINCFFFYFLEIFLFEFSCLAMDQFFSSTFVAFRQHFITKKKIGKNDEFSFSLKPNANRLKSNGTGSTFLRDKLQNRKRSEKFPKKKQMNDFIYNYY